LVGQMTAQLARLRGARVTATEISPIRLSMSTRYCADSVIDATLGPVAAQVSRENPNGFDVVLESTGATSLLDDALALVKPGGRFVFVGWHRDRVEFVFNHPHGKQIRAFFPSGIGPRPVANGILGLMARGNLHIRPLITHMVTLQDAADVYNQLFTPDSDQINAMVVDWRSAH
jgi:threonine dehydrogenase-like Zn-dependent dehydrogenase